jgi:outer membrane protein assembly factor BamB
MNTISTWALTLTFAVPMTVQAQSAVQPVLQRGYDANVSGANLTESTLNTSNVGPITFGRLFNLPVDEKIYAQPLYVPNVVIPNLGSHNVLYVATMNDSVYAFDADAGGAPLWSVNLASLFATTARRRLRWRLAIN